MAWPMTIARPANASRSGAISEKAGAPATMSSVMLVNCNCRLGDGATGIDQTLEAFLCLQAAA